MANENDLVSQVYGGIGSDANFPVGQPILSLGDRDAVIRTIAGEAGGESPYGQAALAHVIFNRVMQGGFGSSPREVVTAPLAGRYGQMGYHQFSTWNSPALQGNNIPNTLQPNSPQYRAIGDIVDKVYSGAIPDPTGGAVNYYAPSGMSGGRPPDWAAPLAARNSTTIGGQVFVGGQSPIVGGPTDIGEGFT